MRRVVWLGNALKNLKGFPAGRPKASWGRAAADPVRRNANDAKPFKGVGSGVLELALRYVSDAYRVVVAVQLGKRIYVLHAFQKKSKTGIATPQRDVDLIKKRYAEAQELAREHEKTKKD
jgi:phage-related protein